MSAVRFETPAAALSPSTLQRILVGLGMKIPVGDAVHRGKAADPASIPALSTHALEHAWARLAPRHLGTLGGGNHFVELDRDGGGDLWLLIHSGSRGIGAAIAAHHLRAAETSGAGTIPGLPLDAPAGEACLSDVEAALTFASANRAALLASAIEVISQFTGVAPVVRRRIDVHHNFVARELHFGRSLLVHRKGAIAAPEGQRALIPGSMGTASYVVMGHGEALSFGSASHGAGRVLTRREAREQITAQKLIHAMRRVAFDSRRSRSLVEEAPAAYRDLGEVLEDEADLVEPIIRLEPIAVLKG